MTLIEAINGIDAMKPNTYTESDKIAWLSALDGMIKKNIIDTHEDGEGVVFDGYTDDTPHDTVLIAGNPYEEMYIAWLESKIDYTNAEYARYNNSITRFNDLFQGYSSYYNRTHMPKGIKHKYR